MSSLNLWAALSGNRSPEKKNLQKRQEMVHIAESSVNGKMAGFKHGRGKQQMKIHEFCPGGEIRCWSTLILNSNSMWHAVT